MKIETLYGLIAWAYDPFRLFWAKTVARRAEDFLDQVVLARYLPPASPILDLGSGTGANLARLQGLGLGFKGYMGIDLTEEMLERAKGKFGAVFCRGDVRRLPFPDGRFDFVISTWVLSHILRPQEAVNEAKRVLKESGYLVLLFWSHPRFPFNVLTISFNLPLQIRGLRREVYRAFPDQVLSRSFFAGMMTVVVSWLSVRAKGSRQRLP